MLRKKKMKKKIVLKSSLYLKLSMNRNADNIFFVLSHTRAIKEACYYDTFVDNLLFVEATFPVTYDFGFLMSKIYRFGISLRV